MYYVLQELHQNQKMIIESQTNLVCYKSVQCELKTFGNFSVNGFENEPKLINYYTGFCDFEQFIFFNCLGPCVSELSHQTTLMDPKDQFYMVLMKLRQAKEDVE